MESNHLKTLRKTDDELVVGNYMVLFGGEDLTGEHFTEKTKFESNYTRTGTLYVDWEHGLDYEDPVSPQRDDILGVVDWKTARQDEMGLWVERILSRRNEYMEYLETLIDEGNIGTSSEAVGGKVRTTTEGKIQVWPLKRDALTVTPAEKRMMTDNAVAALKALSEFQPHLKALLQTEVIGDDNATDAGNEDEKSKTLENNGGTITMAKEITMSVEKYEELRKPDEVPDVTIEIAEDPKVTELTKQVEGLLEIIQNSPKLKDANYVAPDSEEDHPETKSFGDFLAAVRLGNDVRLKSVYKTALAEDTGASGGYGVPVEFGEVLLEKAKDFNALRRAGVPTTVMAGRSKEYPTLDIETAPSAGRTAYAGGVIGYWTEEAAAITESEPRFTMIELILHKLAAYSLASSEIRDDFLESLDGIMARSFAKAIGAAEEYAFFRGDGVGKPKGILESTALISATRSGASLVALADLSQMISDFTPDSYNSGVWFCSPTVLDQIIQLVTNPLTWMDNMRDAWMQSSLLGYPLYVVGALPALNTAGDILLADPNYYLVGDHQSGLNIAFSEHFKFQNDQVAWRITTRVDGQPLIDSSITMEDAATTVSPFVVLAAG